MADVIFLKNIDNVVPDRLKPETVRWKKILGGALIYPPGRHIPDGSVFWRAAMPEMKTSGRLPRFAGRSSCSILPPAFERRSPAERRSFLFRRLNRPLRVCGMVKNEGEPGGGPFWVDDPDGSEVLVPADHRGVADRSATTPGSRISGAPPPISIPSISSAAFATTAGKNSPSRSLSIRRSRSLPANRSRGGNSWLSSGRGSGTVRWPSGTRSLSRCRWRPSIR